jgi:hypothetical protein
LGQNITVVTDYARLATIAVRLLGGP